MEALSTHCRRYDASPDDRADLRDRDIVLRSLREVLREGERIFHTYSTYSRGLDQFINT
jgi:hypothetical protein